ncbi:MAG: orotidine-5'-phosphate decarboxylase [Candidatus Cyclonatronum sp.]|uniref:orotidine-5'-phosphate decarboxylase n=1 Tax=Cyclonatronum sp. TaxID=3024185 RepID=UPI0025BADE08|nr:orotidine-5'-phosphate decarboxylase [Cyclonatronum sp.]MCC5934940.1 orotidine-5'-phosphate decarboxylase [Balneolales bacterium]MCH8487631.1 orotidine-5'-phosphate decarboxylase [Cyclonatronum sp.]
MNFKDKMRVAVGTAGTSLIIGLDPVYEKIPAIIRRKAFSKADAVTTFCREIIEHTTPYCAGYKLNLAFFEALGDQGLDVFGQVCSAIPFDKLLIADAKRGDIGNTTQMYAQAYMRKFRADAVTLNPLMGIETLLPFLKDSRRAVFALTLTSNPGAADFLLQKLENGRTLSEEIATRLQQLSEHDLALGTLGMVVGATQAEKLAPVLDLFPKAPLLIPGFGAQGGKVEELVSLLAARQHAAFPVVGRSIIYEFSDEDEHKWYKTVMLATKHFRKVFEPLKSNIEAFTQAD